MKIKKLKKPKNLTFQVFKKVGMMTKCFPK